jgi:hypothetical protein
MIAARMRKNHSHKIRAKAKSRVVLARALFGTNLLLF